MEKQKGNRIFRIYKRVILSLLIIILCFISFFCVFNIFFPTKYQNLIEYYSSKYNVDKVLVYSIINAESHFSANKVSSKGAVGLMQIMPTTAIYISQKLGQKNYESDSLFDEETNINFCTYYLSYLINKFDNINTAICAYNAGESIVFLWLKNSDYSTDNITLKNVPYTETNNYLKKVNFYYSIYDKIL